MAFSRRSRSASRMESIRAIESSESVGCDKVVIVAFSSFSVENTAGKAAKNNAGMTEYLIGIT